MKRDKFFALLRARDFALFGTSLSQKQVDGINGILDAFSEVGDGRDKTLAYALATAYHETGKAMVPIKETVMPWHKDKNPSDAEVVCRLDNWARKTGRTSNIYWHQTGPHGLNYFGRGHVQLTWLDNYRRSTPDAGVDLVARPEKMLDPVISARILIRGLIDGRWNGRGKGIAYYLPDSQPDDVKNARRTVNITDHWHDVAEYYRAFLTAVEGAGGVSAPLPIDLPDTHPSGAPEASGGILVAIANLLKGFLR